MEMELACFSRGHTYTRYAYTSHIDVRFQCNVLQAVNKPAMHCIGPDQLGQTEPQ
jgi:hypothetical protein